MTTGWSRILIWTLLLWYGGAGAGELPSRATGAMAWLARGAPRCLCVLAYHDSVALLNGKRFVREDGGTWGPSRAMQSDLASSFPFNTDSADGFQRFSALDGRVKFILRENPAREVLHTRQVERNGFIHSLLTGTSLEEKDYRYFGPRVYSAFTER